MMTQIRYSFLKYGVFLLLGWTFSSCSGSSQNTEKFLPGPFIAELNSKTTKTIALNVDSKSHIAWMGLDQSGDYKYFKIEKVTTNGEVTENESGSANEIFEDINVSPSASNSGATGSATSSYPLMITVTYKAKQAMEAVDKPFQATLMIVFDNPSKTMLIQLQGYVEGICTDCKVNPDHKYVYNAVDSDGDGFGDIDFYLCDDKAIPSDQKSSEPLQDESVASDPYAFNVVNLTGEVQGVSDNPTTFIFYTSQKKTGYTIIDAGDDADLLPSVPPFDIEVPGGKPVPKVDVALEEATQSLCPIDSSTGSFTCADSSEDSGVLLSVYTGILNVDPMTLTTGEVTPASAGCDTFGTWTGSGKIGEDVADSDTDLTLIATAVVSNSQQAVVTAANTGIEGALIVAVIHLTYDEANSGDL